jgi:hypothetical protein
MHGRRPPSLSESNIYFGNYQFQSVDEFHAKINNSDKILPLIEDIPNEAIQVKEVPIYSRHLEIFIDYGLRFNFHIFLISIFEIIFYFRFVSKDEDNGIVQTTNYYTQSIVNSCINLSINETNLLNSILNNLVNSSEIISSGNQYANLRNAQNSSLYNLSWSYVGIIGFLQIILFLINYMLKFKIKWKHIILENIVLVMFLGLYEFMFFETIIKNYVVESPQEISALFIKSLQQQCNLLN